MGERRALIIGAPNDRFGTLKFLPRVTEDLHRVVLDRHLGGCVPALPAGRELLLGKAASRAAIEDALADAIASASADQATLFVYFVGHGRRRGSDFYLIAADTPDPDKSGIGPKTAVDLGYQITDLIREHRTVDGLMVVVDACNSGTIIAEPVRGLIGEGVDSRIEFLTATRPHDLTSHGCFTRSLTQLLTTGSGRTADSRLRAYDEHLHLQDHAPEGCSDLAPVHLSVNGAVDAGLWLGHNRLADLTPTIARTPSADLVARLSRDWQYRPGPLDRLLPLLALRRSPIGIVGAAGAGKSTLLTLLGRRSAGELLGLTALATVRPGDDLDDLAEALHQQLSKLLVFRAAAERWAASTPVLEQEGSSLFVRLVTGPLAHLGPADRVRLGVDAADQLDTVTRRRLLDEVADLDGVTLLLTGRVLDEIDPQRRVIVPDLDPDGVVQLVNSAVDHPDVGPRIVTAARGDWLLARILVGLWRSGHALPTDFSASAGAGRSTDTGLQVAFDAAVRAALASAPAAPVERVLELLAAAPVGSWMPLTVLVEALHDTTHEPARGSGSTGAAADEGEDALVRTRDALVALGELVARGDSGQPSERVGPAHDLVAHHLVRRAGPDVVKAAHARLAATVAIQRREADSAVEGYARTQLSEHFWRAGSTGEALARLDRLSTPADTLNMWKLWQARLEDLGPEDEYLLTVRGNVAYWTREAGHLDEALDLFQALLPDQVRVLGADHGDTFNTRNDIALIIGKLGDYQTAHGLFTELLADQLEAWGPDEPALCKTRLNMAGQLNDAGAAAAAAEQFTEVLSLQVAKLGPDHPDTLNTRSLLGVAVANSGDVPGGLALLVDALAEQERVLTPDHELPIRTRSSIATMTTMLDGPQAGLELARVILTDQERILGPEHPDVLSTRSTVASLTAELGDVDGALPTLRELQADQERVIGPHSLDVAKTRLNIAMYTHRGGDNATALTLLTALKTDLDDHAPGNPLILEVRDRIALVTSKAGRTEEAVMILTELLPDQEQAYPEGHPALVRTRAAIAKLRAQLTE